MEILELGGASANTRRRKMAIYDFDHTLVKPKQGRRFPRDAEDWMWTCASVPDIVREKAKKYFTVILTDQSKPWKVDMIRAALTEIGVPCVAIIAFDKELKKPNPALFKSVFPNYSKSRSWMVGDAAGRAGDWSAHDRDVATALSIKFYTPEEVFCAPVPSSARLIFMIGAPGAGKSTYIAQNLGDYTRINGDEYKTSAATIKQARTLLKENINTKVVLDATHGTRERRAAIVALARELGIEPPTAVWINVDKSTALARNAARENSIPAIAIHTFFKRFEEPDAEKEGFNLA